MHRIVRTASSLLRLALVAAVATPAAAQFVEPEVDVIRRLDGAQDAGFFGWITANVGDLDGDGLDDLLVPAIGFDGFSGRVQVFSSADGSVLLDAVGAPGAALGYTATRAGDVDGDGVPDVVVGGGQALVLSGADGSVLLDASGLLPFVDAVAGLGDIDGDGIGDIAIGFSDAATPGAGRVQAVSGSDASVLWTVDGAGPTDGLGSALGRLDDLDGDGVDDLVAGAQNAGPANGGEAFVISGADGTVLRTLRPTRPENASSFGLFFASGTPDMTGDGVGEIYVGDLGAETEKGPATGTAHVFSGRVGRSVRNTVPS
ncbi:MAG: FG-GAP-like repeat-containing protein, partial [Acidobacteriota bacterium]